MNNYRLNAIYPLGGMGISLTEHTFNALQLNNYRGLEPWNIVCGLFRKSTFVIVCPTNGTPN